MIAFKVLANYDLIQGMRLAWAVTNGCLMDMLVQSIIGVVARRGFNGMNMIVIIYNGPILPSSSFTLRCCARMSKSVIVKEDAPAFTDDTLPRATAPASSSSSPIVPTDASDLSSSGAEFQIDFDAFVSTQKDIPFLKM